MSLCRLLAWLRILVLHVLAWHVLACHVHFSWPRAGLLLHQRQRPAPAHAVGSAGSCWGNSGRCEQPTLRCRSAFLNVCASAFLNVGCGRSRSVVLVFPPPCRGRGRRWRELSAGCRSRCCCGGRHKRAVEAPWQCPCRCCRVRVQHRTARHLHPRLALPDHCAQRSGCTPCQPHESRDTDTSLILVTSLTHAILVTSLTLFTSHVTLDTVRLHPMSTASRIMCTPFPLASTAHLCLQLVLHRFRV